MRIRLGLSVELICSLPRLSCLTLQAVGEGCDQTSYGPMRGLACFSLDSHNPSNYRLTPVMRSSYGPVALLRCPYVVWLQPHPFVRALAGSIHDLSACLLVLYPLQCP